MTFRLLLGGPYACNSQQDMRISFSNNYPGKKNTVREMSQSGIPITCIHILLDWNMC